MPANFQDLVALMSRLRSPEGCPWDREQTYATLAPMLLEEAYEAFEAVEEARRGRPEHLREVIRQAVACGVHALGVNCGRDISMEDVIDIIHRYRAVTALPLFALISWTRLPADPTTIGIVLVACLAARVA